MWDEPELPPLGTPDRAKLDREQEAMVRGLLLQYERFAMAAKAALDAKGQKQ